MANGASGVESGEGDYRMRTLMKEEVEVALDDNGEADEGCEPVEARVQELADMEVGTCCGAKGNRCFQVLAKEGYGHRLCRGWFDRVAKEVVGMFHIKIQTDKTAENVERIAVAAGGSLRFNGDSQWEGFKEFEIE